MSWWNRDLRESADITDLAYPPASGGRAKMSLLGFVLPTWLLYHAIISWSHQSAYLPGKNGGEILTGDAARAMAVVYAGLALFAHARWFWGLLPSEWWFEKLTILASFLIIGGILTTLVLALA